MPGWDAITIAIISTGIITITAICAITTVFTGITETDPRGTVFTIAPPRFADFSPGPFAIASPMAGGPVLFGSRRVLSRPEVPRSDSI